MCFLDFFALTVGVFELMCAKKKKAWQSQAEAVTGCHDGKVVNALSPALQC